MVRAEFAGRGFVQFIEENYAGKRCWMIDTWRDEGFCHAFFGAELDVREQPTPFEALAEAGAPFDRLRVMRQVHGTEVLTVDAAMAERLVLSAENSTLEGDAWFVDLSAVSLRGVAFGVRTADCLPVIIRSRSLPFASCIHSGWRGSVAKITTVALRSFAERGVSADDVEVAIGPGARGCCYEIGPEVVPFFENCFDDHRRSAAQDLELLPPLRRTYQSIYVDNATLVLAEVLAAGVPASQIALFSGCTICDDRFFSFRREKELSGRQVSVIGSPRRLDK